MPLGRFLLQLKEQATHQPDIKHRHWTHWLHIQRKESILQASIKPQLQTPKLINTIKRPKKYNKLINTFKLSAQFAIAFQLFPSGKDENPTGDGNHHLRAGHPLQLSGIHRL